MSNAETEQVVALRNQQVDYVASAAKAALGMVPFAGSLLAELAGTIIPNQRIDRLVKFATELEARLTAVDQELVRAKLTDENFSDLMEEGIRQAARSVSNERRQYIAALLANGIRSEDVTFIESKHLLRVLGELNDIEVLWLRFYLDPTMEGDREYRQKHSAIFDTEPAYIGCDQATLDKHAIKESYLRHLTELGLLTPQNEIDRRTLLPAFDNMNGNFKVRSYHTSLLGKLLLRQIELSKSAGNY